MIRDLANVRCIDNNPGDARKVYVHAQENIVEVGPPKSEPRRDNPVKAGVRDSALIGESV
jgi:hypothetical protein